MPGMERSGSSTTAAATTGPARQPRPTSSMPAMRWNPKRRNAFSRVRIARVLTIGASTSNCQRPASKDFGSWELEIGSLLLLRDALFHPRGLALQIPQEIELRAPHTRRSDDVDLGDRRRVQRKDALDGLSHSDIHSRDT